MDFAQLHVHTYYSFLDGLSSPLILVQKAKSLGMTALAITDHNHLGGVYDFQLACNQEGIKPILGCEMYYTPDTNILSLTAEERHNLAYEEAIKNGVVIPDKIDGKKITKKQIKELIAEYEYPTKQFHILFLAINQQGWNNLVKLQSEAADKCTYNGRYLCDIPMIKKYNEGLICTTACVGSYPAQMINQDRFQEAEEYIDEMKNIFGDRFYLEVQPLNDLEQIKTNITYIEWSKKKSINLIATNDVHYANKEDYDNHDTLICMSTGKLKSDIDRMHYSHDFWLRSRQEMQEAFVKQAYSIFNIEEALFENEEYDEYIKAIKQAMDNTVLIADLVEDNIKLGSDTDLFTEQTIPGSLTDKEYLTLLAYKGLYKYLKKHPELNRQKYESRLDYELNIINKKGYAPYMLTVYEYVNWCREQDIPVGPGRGSAAGSLCLFSIGITQNIDPIKYKLLFSRFLTEDRTSPPDVDTDFSYYGRDRLIKHLEDKYGAEKVCHIGTYTELGVKSGIKDVARVLDIPFAISNKITKELDSILADPGVKFKDFEALAEEDETAYNKFKALTDEYPELFRLAKVFEGIPKNMGVHASGVLVTPVPVNDLFPTRYDHKKGVKITLYTGPQLEALKAI